MNNIKADIDEDGDCFVYQEDSDCQSDCQLKDLHIGESFIFQGKRLTKKNKYGWCLAICNVVDDAGVFAWLHPTVNVSRFQ